MKVVLQRVRKARVEVNGAVAGQIDRGVLLLVGIGKKDLPPDAEWLARKIAGLRIFPDADGRMNLALSDVGGSCLAVSQFTLYADCQKGYRPGFTDAASPEKATAAFDRFVELLRNQNLNVETGIFQADMLVTLENDGPVTLLLEREAGV